MKENTKKLVVAIGVCILLGTFGSVGANAGECNGTENLWTEGIPYPCEHDAPVIKTKIAALGCQYDMLSEGPGHNCGSSMKMLHASAGIATVTDTWTEGPDYFNNERADMEHLRLEALKTLPAAGH